MRIFAFHTSCTHAADVVREQERVREREREREIERVSGKEAARRVRRMEIERQRGHCITQAETIFTRYSAACGICRSSIGRLSSDLAYWDRVNTGRTGLAAQ